MPTKLTIFRKGLILVAAPLLFQLALIGVVAVMQRQVTEADRIADHSKEVLAKAHSFQGSLVDLETGSRGYALTKNPVFTEPYDHALKEVPAEIQGLKSLVSDNPSQQSKVEAIAAKASRFIEWHAKRIQVVRDGGSENPEIRLDGKHQMDEMRNDITAFLREGERLDAERTARRDQARQVLQGILIGGAVAAFAITLLLAFVFNRGIGGRLAVLTDNAGRLAQGKELAAPVGGTDEISEVDRAFRDMAQAIRLNTDIVKSVPIGLLIWRLDNPDDDRSLRLVDANPSASGLLGVDVHAMLGRTILQAFPSVTAELQKAYANVVRTGTPKVIEDIHYGDERVKTNYWTVKAFPLPDRRVGLAFENISARKRAEEALRESEDRFRALADNIAQLAWMADEKGWIFWYNKRWFDYTGTTLEQMQGWGWQNVHAPDHVGRVVEKITRCFETGEVWEDTFPLRGKDGTFRWFLSRAIPIHNERGEVIRWFGTNTDITERKQAEDAIRRFNEELEQRVEQRTAELVEANRELNQKSQENEMFVYSVSHDLRSPLVNLQGFSIELEKGRDTLTRLMTEDGVPEALREQSLAVLNGKMTKSLGFIKTAVLRLSNIIDALLRLSRAGRVEYRWDRVDMNRLASTVIDAARATIRERNATVRVGDLAPTSGDPTALEQVLANLVGNALTYLDPSRPGLIEVGCTANGQAQASDGMQVYYVKDNGLGIAEAYQQKVFQVFQRAHPGVGKGEGIGLAIVARVVERHHGRVWIESTVGVGSTFFVALPGKFAEATRS